MPKVVKYSTTTPSGSLRKGNMSIGPGYFDYGISFYSAIEPPASGYTIYLNKATQGPSIYCPANEAELIFVTKQISGTTYASAAECLNYFATQTDKVVIASSDTIPVSATSGSALNLEANMVCSYPTTNTTWYDLSGNGNNTTLNNNPVFISTGGFIFDGSDDYVSTGKGFDQLGIGNSSYTAEILYYRNSTNGADQTLFGVQADGVGNGLHLILRGNCPYFGHYGSDTGASVQTTVGFFRVAFVFEKTANLTGNQLIYINGSLNVTGTGKSSLNNTNAYPINIGGLSYWGYYNGNIYSAKIYNKALTQAEINQNYYQAPIVTSSLSYIWDAGNIISYPKTGTTTYNLTGSINGTLQNGVSYNSGYGGYWSFDGTNDRILLDNANYSFSLGDGNSNWTVNAWIRTTTGANGLGQGSVLSNSNGGPVYSEMGVNGGKIVYWVYPSNINNWKGWTGNITVNNGTWHMLTWVNKVGYTMDMYVDGVLDVTISPTNAGNNNPIDIIGGSWAGVFQGDIATVQVYQGKAFNGNEVNQNFSAQRNRFGI